MSWMMTGGAERPITTVSWSDARLLIVDDQETNIMVLERLLRREGYTHIRGTTKSAEALGLCREFQPDLILLDLRMPGLDGYMVLEQLADYLPSDTYLPVLMLTADDNEQAKRRALALGAQDLLTKPFDFLEVVLRIRNLLETRRLHLQLQQHNVRLADEVRARTRDLEEQMAEAERARAEARAVLDASSDAMLWIGLDGRMRSTNRQFGVFFELRQDDADARRENDVASLVQRSLVDPESFLTQCRRWVDEPDGQFRMEIEQQWPVERVLEVTSTPVENIGRLFAFRDVTRERAVDRMKTEFVALVSHELRTPLTSIKGYLELVLGGEVGDVNTDQREFLRIVESNADRLASLINELLDVSRIESGKIELHREHVNLVRLVDDVATSLRPLFERKRHVLRVELPETPPTIFADVERLTQILTNLLSNAHKYTAVGGQITCAVTTTGGVVRIAVRDTGIGMTTEEQSQLFTRFFRARNRATEEVSGTGLGLTITKSLVELQGGVIEVVSAPGEGSTFTVTLPRFDAPVDAPQAPRPANLVTGHGKILVIEDEPHIAKLLQRFLTRGGYEVTVAYDGASGLRAAQTERPDLIALDLVLPDTDGFAVLDQLKHKEATASIPVLIISSKPDDGRGRLLGAAGYFTKPIVEDSLLHQVGRVMSGDCAHLVVVADADAAERSRVTTQLCQAGYRVIEASSGDEAVKVVRREPPGLVVMALGTSRADALAALSALRNDAAAHDLPAVLMLPSPIGLEPSLPVIDVWQSCALLSTPCTTEELADAIARSLILWRDGPDSRVGDTVEGAAPALTAS